MQGLGPGILLVITFNAGSKFWSPLVSNSSGGRGGVGLAHVHKHRAAVVPSQLGHGQVYLAHCNSVARKKGPEDKSAKSPSATLVPVPARFRVFRSRHKIAA